MINGTERRNLILEAIRQLDKFNVIVEDNDDGYFDYDMELLLVVLSSFENEAKLHTKLIKVDHLTKETIPKFPAST